MYIIIKVVNNIISVYNVCMRYVSYTLSRENTGWCEIDILGRSSLVKIT